MAEKYDVKPSDLLKIWSVPSSSGSAKQLTIRIPLSVFVKVKALEEMFPSRSRNELIADLLSTALVEFESSLPKEWVKEHDVEFEGMLIPVEAHWEGAGADFIKLVDKYTKEFQDDSAMKSEDVAP